MHGEVFLMARLHRPYIPIDIRLIVASRQLRDRGAKLDRSILYGLGLQFAGGFPGDPTLSFSRKLRSVLAALFGNAKVELHHRPALLNRPRNRSGTDYVPSANDPDFLIYLEKGAHDIETRVRGIGAQRSDLSQARYLKKVKSNRGPKPKRGPRIKSAGFRKSANKPKWSKRGFRS
jgi:hypothetical protein